MTLLVDRSFLVRAISMDSQARTTNDGNRPVRIGVADGILDTWDTPFLEASSVKGYLDGASAAVAFLPASGADGVDRVRFSAVPAAGKIVAVSADAAAINLDVLEAVQADAEERMAGSVQAAGYKWPITGSALTVVRPEIVREVKELLRARRGQDITRNAAGRTPQEQWRYDIATGKIPLPPDTPKVTASDVDADDAGGVWGSDVAVFGGSDTSEFGQ